MQRVKRAELHTVLKGRFSPILRHKSLKYSCIPSLFILVLAKICSLITLKIKTHSVDSFYPYKVTELSKSVCSQLTEEYINKMNELESAYTRILSETEREYFISGFKLGAKIMIEVYNGRSTTFRES